MAGEAYPGYLKVVFVADGDTPSDMLVHVGGWVLVPDTTPPPTTHAVLGGVPGTGRMGVSGWEWVVAGPQDELMRHVNRIPPAGSWTDLDARRVWRRQADWLRSQGVSATELRAVLTEMYLAAVANDNAPPPPA